MMRKCDTAGERMSRPPWGVGVVSSWYRGDGLGGMVPAERGACGVGPGLGGLDLLEEATEDDQAGDADAEQGDRVGLGDRAVE